MSLPPNKKEESLSSPSLLSKCLDRKFLWGVTVGIFVTSGLRMLQSVNNLTVDRNISYVPVAVSPTTTVSSASNTAPSREARLLKYHQTYRYVPPASRYGYIPVPAKECGNAPFFNKWFKLPQNVRSRLDEDRYIYKTFFQKNHTDMKEKGTFVELGAFNGAQESNSHFFDKCLGWRGLLIEGNPGNYQKVLENRPYSHKMSFAPSCSAQYERLNRTIPFYWYPMTNVGLPGHARTYEGKPTVDVPCGPLSPVLQDIFGNQSINFFSLDVEGAEMLVLDTIDFQKVQIDVFMIEIENANCKPGRRCKVRDDVRAKMKQEGYTQYSKKVHASDIYVHPNSPFKFTQNQTS